MDAIALRDGMREQGRVIYALLLREIRTRFGHHRIGYAWALVEPMMHMGVMYAMRAIVGGLAPQHIPLLLWLITGIVPFFLFRGVVQRAVGAARGNADVLILPLVRLMDIIWARTLLELMTYCGIFLSMIGLYMAIMGPVEINDPLRVLLCLVLIALIGLGFGMISLTVTSIFPSLQPLVGGVLRVFYVASGALFSVARLPADVQPYLTWNPLLHVFESLRAGFFSDYTAYPGASDLVYATFCALLMWLLGVMLVKRFYMTIMEN